MQGGEIVTEYACMRCGVFLTGDEIALHRKLLSRDAREFLCLDCLAEDCGTTRGKLQQLIDYFHRTGICSLFVKY